MATLVVAPPWLRSERMCSCGRTEEVAGDWWAGFSGWKWACPSGGAYGCLWSAFQAFPATPLVHALINVGGGMYVPYPTL